MFLSSEETCWDNRLNIWVGYVHSVYYIVYPVLLLNSLISISHCVHSATCSALEIKLSAAGKVLLLPCKLRCLPLIDISPHNGVPGNSLLQRVYIFTYVLSVLFFFCIP